MLKEELLTRLRQNLTFLPQADLEERLTFHAEMIDDRIEEGLSEEQAVAAIGTIEEITEQIIREIPLPQIAKEKLCSKHRLSTWVIVLLVLGAPIWLSLAVSVLAVVFSLFITVCCLIISLWAIFVSAIACALGALVSSVALLFSVSLSPALAMLGASATSAGLSIFLFYACKLTTDTVIQLVKKTIYTLKYRLLNREVAK